MAESKWSAELNHNYRNGVGEPMWILRYDPKPGGTKNADGTTSFSMNFPALQLTEWVGEPEKAATDIAAILNAHSEMTEALRKWAAYDAALRQISGTMLLAGDMPNIDAMYDDCFAATTAALAKAGAA